MPDNLDVSRSELCWDDERTFFLPPESWHEPWQLDAREAQHLSRVLRIRSGEEIRVLDGKGREGRFVVQKATKNGVTLKFVDSWMHPRPQKQIILAAGWTKAARRGWFLEKAVEFEATGLWMWQAEHSQFPMPETIPNAWQGQLISGIKQCRNPWMPELRLFPQGLEALLAAVQEKQPEQKMVLLEQGFATVPLNPKNLGSPGLTICVIGPEGGFTQKEVDRLQEAEFQPITLGKRVLRWETAAILSLGLHWWWQGLPKDFRI